MKRTTHGVGLFCLLGFLLGFKGEAQQKPDAPFGSRNTFGIMGEYSNDSSSIVMGTANGEKLGAFGLQYERRLLSRPHFVFSYAAEFRPVIIESNTIQISTTTTTSPSNSGSFTESFLNPSCQAVSSPFTFQLNPNSVPLSGVINTTCGRETTFAQGLSPLGFRVNARPHSRLQPTFSSYEGYIFSTRSLPVTNAGSFNFSFEFGAGIEYYRSLRRSWRLEYQIQHYSNGGSGSLNPGVDNGIFKVTYSFGR